MPAPIFGRFVRRKIGAGNLLRLLEPALQADHEREILPYARFRVRTGCGPAQCRFRLREILGQRVGEPEIGEDRSFLRHDLQCRLVIAACLVVPAHLIEHRALNRQDAPIRLIGAVSAGEYVEFCHDALDWADALVVNPAAWTHYSYAIHDALEPFGGPIVEVHLSNVDEREPWRRVSVISDLVASRVVGKGPDGYREALEYLVSKQ